MIYMCVLRFVHCSYTLKCMRKFPQMQSNTRKHDFFALNVYFRVLTNFHPSFFIELVVIYFGSRTDLRREKLLAGI